MYAPGYRLDCQDNVANVLIIPVKLVMSPSATYFEEILLTAPMVCGLLSPVAVCSEDWIGPSEWDAHVCWVWVVGRRQWSHGH